MDKPVAIKELAFGHFPKVFSVDGVEYAVKENIKSWLASERIDGKRTITHMAFRVRCGESVFDLYRDVKTNAWTLDA